VVIYGVALLSGCLLAGAFLGDLLGELIGVEANVGGVGIAMLLLILLSDRLRARGRLNPTSQGGIVFWSAVYIPVVVAMAARQNVLSALEGGPAALLAGALAVALSFLLVPVISRIGRPRGADPADPDPGEEP
jgi:malonate transporter MadL subunit